MMLGITGILFFLNMMENLQKFDKLSFHCRMSMNFVELSLNTIFESKFKMAVTKLANVTDAREIIHLQIILRICLITINK